MAARLLGDRWLLAILALAALLMLTGIGWGLPNVESWSSDDISPWVPLRVPRTYLFGWHKYPHLHPALSLCVYAPYLVYLVLTGRLDTGCFPSIGVECFSQPDEQLGILILLSRLVSVLMGIGIVLGLALLALRLHGDRRAALATAALASVCSVLVHYAHLGNLDVPQAFWFVASLVCFAGILQSGEPRNYLGFGVLAGCALGTKEGIVGAYVLTGLTIVFVHLRRERDAGIAALWDRRLLGLVGAVVVVYAIATNPLNLEGFVRHWQAWLPGEARMAGYHANFPGWPAFLARMVTSLRAGMGTPLLLACLAGIPLAVAQHRRSLIALVPLASYLLFSVFQAGYAPLRLLLPVALLLTIFGGVAASRALALRGIARGAALALLGLAFVHALGQSARGNWLMLNDTRYAAEDWILGHVPGDARIGAFSQPEYLPRLHWLGFHTERIEGEPDARAALAGARPDYLVLSKAYFPRLRPTQGAFIDDLLAGRAGYSVVYESGRPDPLGRWLIDPPGVAKVSSPIWVMRRTDSSQR